MRWMNTLRDTELPTEAPRSPQPSSPTMPPTRERPDSEKTTARFYRVQEGDTLPSIAKKLYGYEDFWRGIYEANATILETPDELVPGTILYIPGL